MTQQGDMTSDQPGASQPGDGAAAAAEPAGAAEAVAPAGTAEAVAPAGSADAVAPAGSAGGAGRAGTAELYWPSPYLAEGQSIPEAYPAPARPGQPGYGAAVTPFRAGAPARPGRPGHGRPRVPAGRLASPGRTDLSGQAGLPAQSGQAAQTGAMHAGAAGPADAVLASAWERLLAMTMDWMLILGAGFLLLHEQMVQLLHRFQLTLAATQALGPGAGQAAITNFEKAPATTSALLSYFLLVFLMALMYFWALQARGGATVGKLALGLRVVRAADRAPAGLRAAGIRTVAFLLGPAILTFSPGIGLLGATIVSLLGAAMWVADSLVLATDPQKRALHDKLAGTIVVRKARARPPASR